MRYLASVIVLLTLTTITLANPVRFSRVVVVRRPPVVVQQTTVIHQRTAVYHQQLESFQQGAFYQAQGFARNHDGGRTAGPQLAGRLRAAVQEHGRL